MYKSVLQFFFSVFLIYLLLYCWCTAIFSSPLIQLVQLDSSLGYSWASQEHSQSCPEATFDMLCALGHCPAEQ